MENFIRNLFGRFYTANYSDVLRYTGSWRKGSFHGHGVLEYENGGVYEGNFNMGVKHGLGVFSSASGFRYVGDWVDGKQTGSAKILYKNGDRYEGFLKNGLRDGHGELFEPSSKRFYKGHWTRGVLNGEVQITCDDWKFSGTFPDHHGHANGNLAYSDGSTYSGDLKNFTRHGNGKFFSQSGSQIEGQWVDDMNVDQATTTDNDGIQWFGRFENLKPQGFMKVRLPNGQKYDGVWLNGNLQRALSVRNGRNAEPVYHFH